MNRKIIESPVGYFKGKDQTSDPKPMTIEAQSQTDHGDKGHFFFKSFADSFKVREALFMGVIVRISAQMDQVHLDHLEEASITLTIPQAESLIQNLRGEIDNLNAFLEHKASRDQSATKLANNATS
jgi:hypothetical protein